MRNLAVNPRWIAVFLGAVLPLTALADTPTFTNLAPSDYDAIVKEFSGNFAYSSVTPASSLGGFGGFELGLVGGITKDPNLKSIVVAKSPSTNLPNYVAHAGLLARVGLPYAFTVEGMVFPSRTISGISLQQAGGALMWTATDEALEDLPLNISAKASYEKAKLSFTQNASGTFAGQTATVPVNLAYTDTEWAVGVMASKKLLVFEPYVSLAYLHSKGALDLSTNGYTVNVLSQTFGAGANHAESTPTSTQLLAGLDIRLAFFTIGAEYQNSFGATSYTGRLSFRF